MTSACATYRIRASYGGMSKLEGTVNRPEDASPPCEPVASSYVTINDMPVIRNRLQKSELTANAVRTEFAIFAASRDFFIRDLIDRHDQQELSHMAGRFGKANAKASESLQNATHIYRCCLRVFSLDDRRSATMEDVEETIASMTSEITDEIVQRRLAWLTNSAGYRWPASRISVEDARALNQLSNRVKRPVNQLVKEAVAAYTALMLENDQPPRL